MRAIITRGFYIFYPLFVVQFLCFQGGFFRKFCPYSRAVCNHEWVMMVHIRYAHIRQKLLIPPGQQKVPQGWMSSVAPSSLNVLFAQCLARCTTTLKCTKISQLCSSLFAKGLIQHCFATPSQNCHPLQSRGSFPSSCISITK